MSAGKMRDKMAEMPMLQLIFNVSIPLMVSLLVQSLYNIVDAIFVSRLSETALSATSLASPIQMMMIAVSVGTGVGVNSLLSRTLGKGQKAEASKVAMNGLILAIISCLFFVVFGVFFTRKFVELFVNTDNIELMQMSITYISICTIFSLGIFIATMAERLLQASGNTMLSMFSQITGAVANCILDPILIFGFLGIPKMGIAGAAIATVIGQWLAAFVAIVLNIKKNHSIELRLNQYHLDTKIIRNIYKVAVPAILVSGMGSIQTVVINRILISFSSTAVAFFGLYSKVQGFVMMPLNGLSQGLIPIVGYAYGAKMKERIREALKYSLIIALCMTLLFTCIFQIFPEQILSLFAAGEELRSIGIIGLRVLCISFVFVGISSVVGHLFTAVGNGMVNMIATTIRIGLSLAIIIVVVSYVDINDIWWALPTADICAAIYSIFALKIGYQRIEKDMKQ